jgi:hypothetical protein
MSTTKSRIYNFVDDKNLAVPITASRVDGELDAIIAALNEKVLIKATAPASPIDGQTWVDTAQDPIVAKIYDTTTTAWLEILSKTAQITDATTSDFLGIIKSGNGTVFDIDSSATSATVIDIAAANTSGSVLIIDNAGNQASGTMVIFRQNNSSSVADLALFDNDGSGHNLNLNQDAELASEKYCLNVYSGVAQSNSSLAYFWSNASSGTQDQVVVKMTQSYASATAAVLSLGNEGSGRAIQITQNGENSGVYIDINTGQAAIEFDGVSVNSATDLIGVLMSLTNAGAGDSIAFRFNGDEVVSTAVDTSGGFIAKSININIAGTDYALPVYARP